MPINLAQLQLPYLRQLASLPTAGQLTSEQLAQLAELGIKSVIFNRPDAEEAGQPSLASLEAAARQAGLTFHHQPVISGELTLEDGQEFARLCQELPQPVLAFCRTGARCGCLWALGELGKQSAASLISQMQAAGFAMPDFFNQLKRLN